MLLPLYRLATELGSPLLTLHLQRRVRQGKEDPSRLGERAGRASMQRPMGPLVWLHAASVGESLAVLPLIERLLEDRQHLHVLLTTGTVTSAELMAKRLPARAFHQFAPLDRAGAWRAFFDCWRPDIGCLIESEIWPHLLLEAKRLRLPMVLINGRLSARSATRWRWAGGTIRRLLGTFTLCLARSETDAARFRALGAADVSVPGDLKQAANPLPADRAASADLEAVIGDRPVWLAVSTHPGEETEIVGAHRTLRQNRPDLLTVIAPRHPERGPALAEELRRDGEGVARRSLGERPDGATGIYLADTLGELGLFYRLARVAFIGGSLVPNGGQNPLEAARLGCPPLFGPHTGNVEELTEHLLNAGAGRRVADVDELVRAVAGLLDDAVERERMAERAKIAASAEPAVLQRIVKALSPLLDRQLGKADLPDQCHACT